MLKKILIVVVLVIAAVLIYAATKPDTFLLQRSASIAAPADKIFPLINDLRAFNTWNPFAKDDPTSKIAYEGPASGKGAAYSWGGGKSGEGRMEIIDTVMPERLTMKLNFTQPMTAENRVDFTLKPSGGTTEVTWAMSGPMPYISKLMTTFVSMDRMVGGQFEAGLANLKAAAEAR